MSAADLSPHPDHHDPAPLETGWRSAARSTLPALAAAVSETIVLRACSRDLVGWPTFIAVHLAVVALLCGWTYLSGRGRRNIALPLLVTIATAAAGPIGALAAAVTIVLSQTRGEDPRRLREWYDRIAMAADSDDATSLCETITTGRTSALDGAPPASFVQVMEHGSLNDRQAALGIIARNFHPDYLPVLMLALKSAEPVIRVQAAAVATRVRPSLRALIDRHAGLDGSQPQSGSAALVAAAELEAVIASGLVDEGDRLRAEALAKQLASTGRGSSAGRILAPRPVVERRAFEEMLLRQSRFSELRIERRLAAVADRGRYRVRRLARAKRREAA